MKAFAIPTTVSALTAGLSFLFYVGISRQLGDSVLGQIVIIQAVAAIVLMLFLPQCWVYIIGARQIEHVRNRYCCAVVIEVFGITLGAFALGLVLAFPFGIFEGWRGGALLLYFSLAIQGMTSCLGWLRATESWARYALWNIGPNLVRVPLIWAMPWLKHFGIFANVSSDHAILVFIFFLLPDLTRLALIALPIFIRNFAWPGVTATLEVSRTVMRNWLFDLGSTLNETADRLVVGLLMGPQVLVAYFFARRLGIVNTMVTEPFFAEHYRRLSTESSLPFKKSKLNNVYLTGIVFAFTLSIMMISAIYAAGEISVSASFIPSAVLFMFPVFSAILLVDSLIAANRWSRFVTQIEGGAQKLFVVRIACFSLFCIILYIFGGIFAGWGVVLAFAASWLCESVYLAFRIHRFSHP